ncbi:hypothetical protein D0863_12691 [Hortaea werneckii]|uniref:Uncharacterized protein n=1 Tax=Hortaea werneckii TaxID=91943 RepID=A0A3M7CZ43_HORWE|nr:hypothetical protein D0863_12691 [Hortaea werneckii]
MACRFRLAALLSALMTVCPAMQDMEDQAMGLDLTLTYGTAVLWTINSTSSVAMIEGSSEYRSAMSNFVRYSSNDTNDVSIRRPWFCRYFPSLERCTPDQDLVAVADMLYALRTACDGFASEPIPRSGVSVPVKAPWYNPTNQTTFLSAAIDLAGLPRPTGEYFFAGESVAVANGIGHCSFGINCNYWGPSEPTKVVLTVDYSQEAFTASLMSVDGGQFDELYRQTRFDLGAASLQSRDSPHEHWEGVKECLKRALEPTKGALAHYYRNERLKKRLREALHVVVYGDAVDTAGLKAALQECLEIFEPGFVALREYHKMADPVFAAAQGDTAFLWPWDIDRPYSPQVEMEERMNKGEL